MRDGRSSGVSRRAMKALGGAALAAILGLAALACGGSKKKGDDASVHPPDAAVGLDGATARIEGRMGTSGALDEQWGAGVGTRKHGGDVETRRRAVKDSEETSLHGLSVDLVRYDIVMSPGSYEIVERGVEASAVPDDMGRFSFDGLSLPEETPHQFFVRIVQEPGALISYVADGDIRWMEAGDTVQLSLPLVTRLYLPLWTDPDSEDNEGNRARLAADALRGTLVYFTPKKGIGVYDPRTVTVDLLKMASMVDFACRDHRVNVLEKTGQVLVSMTRDTWDPARFILVDLDVFTSEDASEVLDMDDPDTAAMLQDRVTVIDLPGDPDLPVPPMHDYDAASFVVKSIATEDGSRFYFAEDGPTYVFDLKERTHVETIYDGAKLGAYNPHSGHLYFDLPGGTLRVRDASTGAIVSDLDLGARLLNGVVIVPFSDHPRAMVSYQSDTTPLQHRIAIVGTDAEVESDHLAGDYLGFTDRYFDDAFDWSGRCSPEFCANLGEDLCPPKDIFQNLDELEGLQGLSIVFAEERGQLLMQSFVFQLRDDVFYPMPHYSCRRLSGEPDACIGQHTYDPIHMLALIRPLWDRRVTCILYVDGSDITVPVSLDAEPSEFDTFLPHPTLGAAFIGTQKDVTVIHYRSPDAAFLPAVRDMR